MAERIPLIVSHQQYETYIGGINCLFVCLCSEKRVLTISQISTKWTIIFTSPYLT